MQAGQIVATQHAESKLRQGTQDKLGCKGSGCEILSAQELIATLVFQIHALSDKTMCILCKWSHLLELISSSLKWENHPLLLLFSFNVLLWVSFGPAPETLPIFYAVSDLGPPVIASFFFPWKEEEMWEGQWKAWSPPRRDYFPNINSYSQFFPSIYKRSQNCATSATWNFSFWTSRLSSKLV